MIDYEILLLLDPDLAEELVRKNALYGKTLLLRELAKG